MSKKIWGTLTKGPKIESWEQQSMTFPREGTKISADNKDIKDVELIRNPARITAHNKRAAMNLPANGVTLDSKEKQPDKEGFHTKLLWKFRGQISHRSLPEMSGTILEKEARGRED